MSYTVGLPCGCLVYVACHPVDGVAHARIIERRGIKCDVRRHDVGTRLPIWELLPGAAPPGFQPIVAPYRPDSD
jgi:hypothetical protein